MEGTMDVRIAPVVVRSFFEPNESGNFVAAKGAVNLEKIDNILFGDERVVFGIDEEVVEVQDALELNFVS